MNDMPANERPLSEQFRIIAKRYADADAAARLLEELKTATLEQMKQGIIAGDPKLPDSHAERMVKASPEWREYVHKMVDARTDANRLKAQMEYIRMRWNEMQDVNASRRAEMRMSR